MPTQITADLPDLDFPREVDYPTQEDWAAFSAAAEENFGILGGDWSTQMQLWKTEANAMSTELNTNASIAQGLANYQGDWISQGYTLGQTVSVGEVYYICKITHATGQNPTDVSSLYWNLALGNWNLKADKTELSLKVDKDISPYSSKPTPIDSDLIPLSDSSASFGIKKLSWANLKTTLKTYFDTLYVKLIPTIATGTATFTNATNNINLTGVGIGVEVGDVIILSGSTNNNGEFTVEVITDANNIIVNQAHAGRSRTVSPVGLKALINETATVTVKLLSKGYNADSALGRDWVEVTSSRAININYPNITNRAIEISVSVRWYNNNGVLDYIISDADKIAEVGTDNSSTNVIISQLYAKIAKGKNYKLAKTSLGGVVIWSELR